MVKMKDANNFEIKDTGISSLSMLVETCFAYLREMLRQVFHITTKLTIHVEINYYALV